MYAVCVSGLLEVFKYQHFERISNIQQVAFLKHKKDGKFLPTRDMVFKLLRLCTRQVLKSVSCNAKS